MDIIARPASRHCHFSAPKGFFAIQLVVETFIDCSTVSARMGNLARLTAISAVAPTLAVPCDGAGASIVQIAPDLFSFAGAPLAFARRDQSSEFQYQASFSYRDGTSGWQVHCRVEIEEADAAPATDPSQLYFTYTYATAQVAPLVSQPQAAYLNLRLRAAFRETRALQEATLWLKQRDILYVGDLVRMSREALIACLGPRHERAVRQFEAGLGKLGLGLSARVAWWRRPADYYRGYA